MWHLDVHRVLSLNSGDLLLTVCPLFYLPPLLFLTCLILICCWFRNQMNDLVSNDLVSLVYEMKQAPREDPRDTQPERDVRGDHDIKFSCSFTCLYP